MAVKTKTGDYACSYCRQIYSHPEKADECRDNHDLIYLPLSIKDANMLLNFVFSGDISLLRDVKFVPLLQVALRRHQREKKNKSV